MDDGLGTRLAGLRGAKPDAPAWYQALPSSPEAQFELVEGVPIEFFTWGEPGAPGVLLMHGNRAHARWWGPVAPLLAQAGFRVAAMSFSGHGGSGWRESYSVDQLVAEMFSVAAAAGLDADGARFFIAAHSFGGIPAIFAARFHEPALAGVIIVDTALTPVHLELPSDYSRKLRSYGSLAEGLSRFRLAPRQDCENLYLLDGVARDALVEQDGVWRWRFDPLFLDRLDRRDAWPLLRELWGRFAFFYGEQSSIVKGKLLADLHRQAPAGTPFIGIPEAGHHIMLDQPLALTVGLRALLAAWLMEDSISAEAKGVLF
jgi:pimeloyl-ACP methyl ester carboxylesterase